MNDDLKTYRIRTKVGEDKPTVINVPLTQTYDTFEILSLKIDQSNSYKYYTSDYGTISKVRQSIYQFGEDAPEYDTVDAYNFFVCHSHLHPKLSFWDFLSKEYPLKIPLV